LTADRPDADLRGPQRRQRALTLVSVICSGPVLIVVLAVALVADRHWLTVPVTYGPPLPWLLLPLPALGLALRFRRFGIAGLHFAIWVAAVLILGCWRPPLLHPAAETDRDLRVVTWNVSGIFKRAEMVSPHVRPLLTQFDADIICLQEVRPRDFEYELPGYDMAHAGDVRMWVRGRILSTWQLTTQSVPRRHALSCEVEIDGKRLHVTSAHWLTSAARTSVWHTVFMEPLQLKSYLQDTAQVRAEQCDTILSWLPEDAPVIFAGDLNTPPTSVSIKRLAARMQDCFAEAGSGFGMSFLIRRNFPLIRIDYIWASDELTPIACRTGDSYPSDHRPVIADLSFRGWALPAPPR